jgi:flavin reductase (DIM6/NTAB) family NADH-FMN oxidoreductase RutF
VDRKAHKVDTKGKKIKFVTMRKEVNVKSVFDRTLEKMKGPGVILLAGDPPNPMTIGWGTIGFIWGKLVFTVLVRPSRFTYSRMESSGEFTVNLLPDAFSRKLSLCGTKSGRDIDKMAKCGFRLEQGIHVNTSYIRESSIHFECRIIYKHDLLAETLDTGILKKYYPKQDLHRVYYGEIVGVFREK